MQATMNITTNDDNSNANFEMLLDGTVISHVDVELYEELGIDEDGCDTVEDTYLLLGGVYTAPEHRGQGYSRQLMMAAIAWAQEAHPSLYLRLIPRPDPDTSFDRLVSFYESCGFTADGYGDDEQGCMSI